MGYYTKSYSQGKIESDNLYPCKELVLIVYHKALPMLTLMYQVGTFNEIICTINGGYYVTFP
jgi:hypothetical protein